MRASAFLAVFVALHIRSVVMDDWNRHEEYYGVEVDSNFSIAKPPTCGVKISGPFYTDMVLTE